MHATELPSPIHRRCRYPSIPSFITPTPLLNAYRPLLIPSASSTIKSTPVLSLPTCTTPSPTRVTVSIPSPLGVSLTETVANGSRRVVVTSVRQDSPANGLVQVGDVVMAAAGTSAKSLNAVVRNIRDVAPQQNVTLDLERILDNEQPHSVIDSSPSPQHQQLFIDSGSAIPVPPFSNDIQPFGIYSDQDATLSGLISNYVTNRKVSEQFAAPELKNLINTAIQYVRSRGKLTAKSSQLILSVFHRLKGARVPLTTRFCNVVMTALIQSGDPTRAIDIFSQIHQPNIECFTSLVKAFSVLRRPDDAIALVPVMRARGITPNIHTYNALISSCVRGGKLSKARRLFSEMLNDKIRPNTVSWNIIINWHVQQNKGTKRLAGALQAFADMKASGISPNVVTFTTLMKAYSKSGFLNKAEEVFSEMKRTMPAQLDAGVYNTLLDPYAARSDWRRCVELLSEMENTHDHSRDDLLLEESVERSSFERADVPAHSSSFSRQRPWLDEQRGASTESFGDNYERRDEGIQQASDSTLHLQIREEARVRANEVSYSLAIKACAGAGRIDLARNIFDRMMERGFYPPVSPSVVSLLSGYANTGRLGDCFEVLKSLKTWGLFPEVKMLSTVMHGCLVAGRAELALSVYTKFKTERLRADVVTDTLLARAYGTLGEMDNMFKVIDDMRRRGRGERPSVITYNAVIERCLWHARIDLALHTLDLLLKERGAHMRMNRQTANALVCPVLEEDMISDCKPFVGSGRKGKLIGVLESPGQCLSDETKLNYLSTVLKKIREGGAVPNGVLYRALLNFCERCGRWDLGHDLVKEREKGLYLIGRKELTHVRTLEDLFRAKFVQESG